MKTRQATGARARASYSWAATATAPRSNTKNKEEEEKEKKREHNKVPSSSLAKVTAAPSKNMNNIKKNKKETVRVQQKDPSPHQQQKKTKKKQPLQLQKQQLQLLQKPPFPLYRTAIKSSTNAEGGKGETTTGEEKEEVSFREGLESVVNLLRNKKKIVVLTGAGISVSCGIPDFRSRGTGLYSTLDAEELGLSCPEELFDYEVFLDNPTPFYRFARNLYFPLGNDRRVQPSDSHKLLSLLEEKKMLLRVYSQNIDGLEQKAGVSNKKVVHAHGSLQWATCCLCKRKVSADQIEADILNGNVARCQAHVGNSNSSSTSAAAATTSNNINGVNRNTRSNATTSPPQPPQRSTRKRPRPENGNNNNVNNSNGVDQRCGGVMKPGVTFFGEVLRDNVRRALEADRNKVDALIVIGTSLSVAPISKVIGYLPANIPRILINRTIVHPSQPPEDCREDDDDGDDDDENDDADDDSEFRENYVFDAYLLGYCDDVTRSLARKLFSDDESSNNKTRNSREEGGKLLACLEDDDDVYDKEDWSTVSVPTDRVFLFPGAQAPSTDTYGDSGNDTGTEHAFREIAHCDGCNEHIVGTIKKCATCFDYDLCSKCYPRISKTHHEGKHHFYAEKAA